jgi:PKHD-type hydroxylase
LIVYGQFQYHQVFSGAVGSGKQMLVVIPDVLGSTELQQVQTLLDGGHFVDGRLSAGTAAKRVKHNEELHANASQMERLNSLVMGRLVQNATFQAATMPYRIASPYYARYTAGMSYGDHVDDPVMGPPGGQYRSDVSTTVFLNPPEEYQGGELVIRTSFGEQRLKLPAGDAVVYPSSSLHHITEVTAGQRLVAVTWTQSMLRDPQQRELLFQLYRAREKLLSKHPDAEETTRIDHVYVNLVRMWSEL